MAQPSRRERRAKKKPPAEIADLTVRRELWPLAEAAYRLGMCRQTLYRRYWDGEIKFVRVGRRVYVTDAEIRRYVANLEAAS
jgi:excisionase family DNA binding protein